ncbi:hypothetical protein LTR85_001739 [Meristemomyces frigidus]|nr:hypothetical protein LTR85_001739 [Meristemomyces frigidus]
MAASQIFENQPEACINASLREEYPFTQSSIINEVASCAANNAATRVIRLKKEDASAGVRALDFLDLPAELRNRIYEHVVVAADSGTIKIWSSMDAGYNGSHRQPAITMASRQLRGETLSTFYALNSFVIRLQPRNAWAAIIEFHTNNLNKWLKAIGEHNIKDIHPVTAKGTAPKTSDTPWTPSPKTKLTNDGSGPGILQVLRTVGKRRKRTAREDETGGGAHKKLQFAGYIGDHHPNLDVVQQMRERPEALVTMQNADDDAQEVLSSIPINLQLNLERGMKQAREDLHRYLRENKDIAARLERGVLVADCDPRVYGQMQFRDSIRLQFKCAEFNLQLSSLRMLIPPAPTDTSEEPEDMVYELMTCDWDLLREDLESAFPRDDGKEVRVDVRLRPLLTVHKEEAMEDWRAFHLRQ